MKEYWATACKRKIVPPELLEAKVEEIRRGGKRIATLNGSFDLLHAGHLQIIFEASRIADVLIIALNTDRSIQEYKSPVRPIITLEYRIQMVSALSFVDYVTWFDETDPRKILGTIKPDVHVNGAEYGQNCLEADIVKSYGGELHLVNLVPGLSTSQILKKISSLQEKGT